MGTHVHDQPPEHWAGPESLDPTPVWKQFLLVGGLLVLSLALIGVVAAAALAAQLVTPPAAVPGGRVVLALADMPGAGDEPRFYGPPLVEEERAFWIGRPAQGELVAVRATWAPADGEPPCRVVALPPITGSVWGYSAECPAGVELEGSPVFGPRGEPIAAPRSLGRYLVSVDGERVIVNVAREIREYGANPAAARLAIGDAVSARPYEVVIGIETHVELATRSKMFCGCSARWFGAPPNTLTCPVCLGLPGALPVPNRRAIELAITAGLALHCEVPEHTKFDRKNYMYPDLAKGYQISQYDLPLNVNGWVEIASGKRVGIVRAHLEEDTGKLTHGAGYSLVDFNRSGVPLLEIVSAPDMGSVDEALEYAETIRETLVHAAVSEFRLEEGAARFDTNVSIRFEEDGRTVWPPQSEIKNLNSYRALEQAVTHEAERLWEDWQAGGEIRSRKAKITVGWSPDTGRTFLQRRKEESEDYRYFPEPDLVTYAPSRETVEALRAALPEMPSERRARFVAQYGIAEKDARVLVAEPALAAFYEDAVRSAGGEGKAVANWMTGELLRRMKEQGARPGDVPVTPDGLAALVRLVAAGTVSGTAAKDVFAEMWASRKAPDAIVKEKGLEQVSDESAIAAAVEEAIAADPKAVADFKAGRTRALEALFGKVMARTKGKANPQVVRKLLSERLSA